MGRRSYNLFRSVKAQPETLGRTRVDIRQIPMMCRLDVLPRGPHVRSFATRARLGYQVRMFAAAKLMPPDLLQTRCLTLDVARCDAQSQWQAA